MSSAIWRPFSSGLSVVRGNYFYRLLYTAKSLAYIAADLKSHALVRPARVDDFDAVMAVNHWVYDGADYLPARYHEYLKKARVDCFVLELAGKIVS